MSPEQTPGHDLLHGRGTGVKNEISDSLPGAAFVRRGLADLAAGRKSDESLLVQIGAPRLRRNGFIVADADVPGAEIELYARLSATGADAAHSRYNALIRLLVSFERAVESGG